MLSIQQMFQNCIFWQVQESDINSSSIDAGSKQLKFLNASPSPLFTCQFINQQYMSSTYFPNAKNTSLEQGEPQSFSHRAEDDQPAPSPEKIILNKIIFRSIVLATFLVGYLIFSHLQSNRLNEEAYKNILSLRAKNNIVPKNQHSEGKYLYGPLLGFPKVVWVYVLSKNAESKYYKNALENLRKNTEHSGYSLEILIEGEQYHHLKEESGRYIKQVLGINYLKGLRKEDIKYATLQRDLLKLYTLIEKGGVWVDPEVVLFQNIDWLNSLRNNPLVINKEGDEYFPKIFTFHQFQYNHIPHETLTQQYLTNTKCHLYFIATQPQPQLFIQALEEYRQGIHQEYLNNQFQKRKKETPQQIQKYSTLLNEIVDNILNEKQKHLEKIAKEERVQNLKPSGGKKNAVHHYQLWQMRADMFSKKLSFANNFKVEAIVQSLLDYTEKEMNLILGPMKYLTHFDPKIISEIDFKVQWMGGEPKLPPHSIYYNYLMLEKDAERQENDLQSPLLSINNKAEPIPFPKYIWIYWSKGFSNLKLTQELCLNLIKKFSKESKFQLILLDDQNFVQYLSYEAQQKLESALTNVKMTLEVTTKADLMRMLLLIENGGVWMDLSTILLDNLDWLNNLKQSQEIFHQRLSGSPKVFMIYNQQHGGKQFIRNSTNQERIYTSPIFEIFFIAAQPKAPFLINLLDHTISYLTHPPSYYIQEIDANQIEISDSIKLVPYLIPMVAVQYLLQNRQKIADLYPVEYYEVWGMDSRVSAYKLETNGDFGFQRLNQMMLYRSQKYTQECLGKHQHFIKLNHYGIPILELSLNSLGKDESSINPDSLYMKYLFEATEENKRILKKMRKAGKDSLMPQ